MKTFSSKIIRVLFTFCMALLFTMTKNVSAENAISVYLNQKPVTFSASPIVRDNRVLVPARDMFEAMAYQVNWNHATDTVSITKDITTITLKIGSNIALKNDVSIPLDVAPINFNGKTYIPLRFVAENTSADVKWNEAARTIYITTSASNENRLLQSVVKIQTNKIQGSGIILSTDGYIATNFHVLENATTGQIQFQNGEYYNGNITLVGYDTVKDIAIIKINMTGLVPVIFAKSNELHINNPVTAIGSPGGNLNVVSKGVVIGTRDYIIATTAAIRHGSSGGALFNQNGQLIGMTSSFGGESYYSIPARFIQELPRNLNIPLNEISNITPTLRAPKNISVSVEQREAHISWEPIYGIDYFHLYISSELNGEYTKVINPKNQSDQWFWGYPYCFGMTVSHPKEFYLKIVSVQNGVSSAPSEIIKVVIE